MRIIENIKSVILTILILSSLVLTGSLWFDNYQGLSLVLSNLPANLTERFFGMSEQEYSKRYEELIMPYKVIIAADEDGRWIAYQSDSLCAEAWNFMKSKLNEITEANEIITGDMNEWKDLVNRKSLIIQFGGAMDFEVLKIVLPNMKTLKQDAFNNIEKIAITKSVDGSVIYICKKTNGKNVLNKVLIKDKLADLDGILQKAVQEKASSKFVTISETGTNKFYGSKTIEPIEDVLFPISNKQDKRNKVYKINGKLFFKDNDEYAMNKLATAIFKNTDFAKFVTNNDGNIYINDDKSSIWIEKNGIMKYSNNSSKTLEENTSASVCFDAAIDFINKLGVYENIYLFSTLQDTEGYIFRFGTSIGGIPVSFHDNSITDEERAIIEIKVYNGTVKSFAGKLMTFSLTNENAYITAFAHNILDNILAEMSNNETMKIDSIRLIYDASNDGNYYPSWQVNYRVGSEKGESIIKATKK